MKNKKGLTPKQSMFVKEYLIDLNATQAAIRAGYSKKNAGKIGPELIGKTRIAAEVQKAISKRSEKTEVTAERVIQELSKLGFSNLMNYFKLTGDGDPYIDLADLTPEQAASLTEIQVEDYVDGRGEDARAVKRVKIKVADKKGALELLGKHLGLFTDKIDLTSGGLVIKMWSPSDEKKKKKSAEKQSDESVNEDHDD